MRLMLLALPMDVVQFPANHIRGKIERTTSAPVNTPTPPEGDDVPSG